MIRNELSEMISLGERLNAADEPAVLATLFAANGSTYRPLGSMMLGGPSSALTVGGGSGGCLEEFIARRGRALTDQQPAAMLSFDADPDADHTGVPSLGCGGSIEVLVERFTPEHLAFLRRFAAAHDADQSSTAACVIDASASPAITVRRFPLIDGDEATSLNPRLERLRERAMRASRSVQEPIGSDLRALVHYVRPLVRLVILGAGNDARRHRIDFRHQRLHLLAGDWVDRQARAAPELPLWAYGVAEVVIACWAAVLAVSVKARRRG